MMAEQENKNSDCQLPFPGPWQVLQFNREMRRHEALMSHCLRSFSRLQNETVFRGRGPEILFSEACLAGLTQAWGLPGDMTAAGTGNDGVKCPPLSVASGYRLAGVVGEYGFHSFF